MKPGTLAPVQVVGVVVAVAVFLLAIWILSHDGIRMRPWPNNPDVVGRQSVPTVHRVGRSVASARQTPAA